MGKSTCEAKVHLLLSPLHKVASSRSAAEMYMGDESHTAKLRSGLEGGFVHAVVIRICKLLQQKPQSASVSRHMHHAGYCRARL